MNDIRQTEYVTTMEKVVYRRVVLWVECGRISKQNWMVHWAPFATTLHRYILVAKCLPGQFNLSSRTVMLW